MRVVGAPSETDNDLAVSEFNIGTCMHDLSEDGAAFYDFGAVAEQFAQDSIMVAGHQRGL